MAENSLSRDHSFDNRSVNLRPIRGDMSRDDSHDFSQIKDAGRETTTGPTRNGFKRRKVLRSGSREADTSLVHLIFPGASEAISTQPLALPKIEYEPFQKSTFSKAEMPPQPPKKQKEKAVKRVKPESASSIGSGDDEESRKAKQERNRVCARECRKRKKMYLENMEAQVKALREELMECRKELARYKAKEQEGVLARFNDTQLLSDAFRKVEINTGKGKGGENNPKELLKQYMVSCYSYGGIII